MQKINNSAFALFLAVALIFPFYIGISTNGISFPLPLVRGINEVPLPISVPIFICISLFYFLKEPSFRNYAVLSYFAIMASQTDSPRVAQVGLIFAYFIVFQNVSPEFLKKIFSYTVYAAIALFFMHDLYFLFVALKEKQQLRSGFVYLFGIPIYSAYISYISVIFLTYVAANQMGQKVKLWAGLVCFPLLVFSERTIALIYVSVSLIFKRMFSIIFIGLIGLLIYSYFSQDVSYLFARTIGKFHGESGGLSGARPEHWSLVIHELQSPADFLFGPHKYDLRPHNYWLQLLNVGGLPLVLLMGFFFLNLLKNAWRVRGKDVTPFLLFILWFILDTNINSPLTQPYVTGMAMLVLVYMSRRGEYVQK